MADELYNKKVMDHFMNPRNVGAIEDADGIGEKGNPVCGDLMKMFIKVSRRSVTNGQKWEEILEDIKFQTFGCGAAVASSSMITEMVKGKTLEEAERISNEQVARELGGLPPIKMHCSNLAASALHEAIEDYKKKNHQLS